MKLIKKPCGLGSAREVVSSARWTCPPSTSPDYLRYQFDFPARGGEKVSRRSGQARSNESHRRGGSPTSPNGLLSSDWFPQGKLHL